MSDDQVLLHGILVYNGPDDAKPDWHDGGQPGGALVFEGSRFEYAKEAAIQLGGEVAPYLTLRQVMGWIIEAKKTGLKDAPAAQRALLDSVFKLVGL